jgi:excinuclease ABC subunit C
LNNRTRPCLQYQIKRCPAPCVFELPEGEYEANATNVAAFLDGRADDLVANLTARMSGHADRLEYEQAARLRDQIKAVKQSLERQEVASPDFVDRDVIGLYREGPTVEIHVMRTRGGRLIGAKRYSYSDLETPTEDIISDFVTRYYSSEDQAPNEILVPTKVIFGNSLGALLTEKQDKAIKFFAPQRGVKKKLVALANKNAKQAFTDKKRQEGEAKTTLERLKKALRLRSEPLHIECYDISHFQGTHIVASGVAFVNGVPDKSLYRHFKIRSTQDQDDFKSMYEVISRRTRRGLEEGNLPNLMVIDGGKGQLSSARAALDDHGVDWIDLISLAKSRIKTRNVKDVQRSSERVFVEGIKDPIVLRTNSSELFLLMRARDEAHRFAIEFQRKKRRQASSRSSLENIPGIGPKRRKQLLSKLGSAKQVQRASLEELSAVVGHKAAQSICDYFSSLTLPKREHS